MKKVEDFVKSFLLTSPANRLGVPREYLEAVFEQAKEVDRWADELNTLSCYLRDRFASVAEASGQDGFALTSSTFTTLRSEALHAYEQAAHRHQGSVAALERLLGAASDQHVKSAWKTWCETGKLR